MKLINIYNKNISNSAKAYIFLIILCGYSFGYFVLIPPVFIQFMGMLGIVSIFLLCYKEIFIIKADTVPYKLMRIYLLLYLISAISCWLFRGQSLMLSYRVIYINLYISFFFVLVKYKLNIASVETLFSGIGKMHIALFLVALSLAPIVVFGNPDIELDTSRGSYRLAVKIGWDCFLLYYFYFLNKWKRMNVVKYWGIFSILFIIIVYHLTRTTILSVGVITVFYFVFKMRSFYRLIPIVVAFCFYFLFGHIISDNEVVQGILETSEEQIQNNASNDDIRIFEYEFFFTMFNDSWKTSVLGNGVSHVESKYGKQIESLRENLHVYESDVGWAAVYVMFGWIGILFTLFWFIYVLIQKIPEQYYYLKLITFYYIIGNISAGPSFSHVFSVSMSLYVLHCILLNKERNVFIKQSETSRFLRLN